MTVSEGAIHGFENGFSFARLIFNVNRILTPLHALKTEEEVTEFFAEPAKVFSKEYMTPLFKNAKDQERLKGELTPEFESVVANLPLKTRVVVFYYDAEEYKVELEDLRVGARFVQVREDLRVAYVTDKNLVKKMKRKNPGWFEKVGYSSAVLKRYDGQYVKFDITSGDKVEYA